VKENATNYLEKLKAEGFDAEIAGTKDGMTLVAYGIYTSRNEAENALTNLRSSDDVRAWIRQQ
jgi:cell division septation protein DedD